MNSSQLQFELVKLAIQVIALGVTMYFAIRQLRKQTELFRARLTSDIVNSWDDRLLEYRRIVERAYGEYLVIDHKISQQGPSPLDVAKTDVRDQIEIYNIKEAAIYILNFFDDVAALFLDGHLDTDIAEKLLKPPIRGMCRKLKPLRDAINAETFRQEYGNDCLYDGRDAWPSLNELINKWGE